MFTTAIDRPRLRQQFMLRIYGIGPALSPLLGPMTAIDEILWVILV